MIRMGSTPKDFLVVLILCLTALGCSRASTPSWSPFAPPVVIHVPGVVSPSERIESLKALAENAPNTPDPAQRESICQGLAVEIGKEEDPVLRGEIVRTLGVYGGPTAETVLHRAVNDPDVDVRIIACAAWGKHGGPEGAKVLSGVLTSDIDKDVRMAAARGLGPCHDPSAVPALSTALEDPDPAMQHRAVVALCDITGKDFGNDVNRWREYVKTGTAKPADAPSLADRFHRWFW
jgi:hypothetical protein